MDTYFTQSEVFPIIARVIITNYQRTGDWVTHKEIASALLADELGNQMVQTARAKQPKWSEQRWAGNMVAWFSQRITEDRSDYDERFERRKQGQSYAYRPRQAGKGQAISDEDYKRIVELRAVYARRKHILELQAAHHGINVDPHVPMEIAELVEKIAELDSKLLGSHSIHPLLLQHWLQRKLELYSVILEQLACMQVFYNRKYANEIEGEDINEEYLVQLNEQSNTSYRSIEKLTYMGDFVVSADIIEALRKLTVDLQKRDREGHWQQDLDDHYGAIIECISKVREFAKADLQQK